MVTKAKRLKAISVARASGKTIVPVTLADTGWGVYLPPHHKQGNCRISVQDFPWSCGYIVASFVNSGIRASRIADHYNGMLWYLCRQKYNGCVLTDVTTGGGAKRKHWITGTFAMMLARQFPDLCISFPPLRNLNTGRYIQMHHVHLGELRRRIYFDVTIAMDDASEVSTND